jgi:hypothetical protein
MQSACCQVAGGRSCIGVVDEMNFCNNLSEHQQNSISQVSLSGLSPLDFSDTTCFDSRTNGLFNRD